MEIESQYRFGKDELEYVSGDLLKELSGSGANKDVP
jgi:hypothetical protein